MVNDNIPLLCNDVVFKSILLSNDDLLVKFIYDITGYFLDDINVCVTELPIIRKNEKFKRCDILVRSNNLIIDFELNSSYYNSLVIKNLNYLFSLFLNNNVRGEKYNKDLEIIQININNYSRFNKPILDFGIINSSYDIVYFRGLKIYDLDIVKCRYVYYNEYIRKRNYIKWGMLFSSKDLDEIEFIIKDLIGIRKGEVFMSKLKKMTVETYVMDEAEALREEKIFRNSIYEEGMEIGMNKGIEKGIEKGKLETISSMIKNSVSFDLISKITGKSINEIDKIAKSM